MNGNSPVFVSGPCAGVAGEIRVPGDKSISHRALMLGAIADGRTEASGFLDSADCRATLGACVAMGVKVDRPAPDRLIIHGAGMHGLKAPGAALDLGNSGTAMRLLAGLLCAQDFDSVLVGDSSLSRRPMERIAAPLRRMGADIRTNGGRPPLAISGRRSLRGCAHELEVPSAQVKSAILLAGLYAKGRTSVTEPVPTRDHTERMLQALGVAVSRDDATVSLAGPVALSGTTIVVPGDFSSAAFFIVAGVVAGRGPLLIRGIGVNPTRTGLLDILGLMGADIRLLNPRECGREPVADLQVMPGALRGINVPHELVASTIDEFPVLFAAAALADGETLVRGAAELRVKESDRIAVMADGLRALGVQVETLPDGLRIQGGPVGGGIVESRGDHRVAMAFAVLAARAAEPVVIRDVRHVATSFPGFVATARLAGLELDEEARA
ncbi:MAG TPA: 3-phosphoshikimate 1-carboxyvinyltransferase [Steroidobacteraceae bacterium]|nr:3-phosphoshikimate 1-carboxyvinyltransferase [Steroidobacteraceae bacterium]